MATTDRPDRKCSVVRGRGGEGGEEREGEVLVFAFGEVTVSTLEFPPLRPLNQPKRHVVPLGVPAVAAVAQVVQSVEVRQVELLHEGLGLFWLGKVGWGWVAMVGRWWHG